MKLNLPILDQIEGCKNVLIAGTGGGFDVFCGLPLYFEIQEKRRVHLGNYTFTDVEKLQVEWIEKYETTNSPVLRGIEGILPDRAGRPSYFPEGYLAEWFKISQNQDQIVWLFPKTGTKPLLQQYRTLVSEMEIDAIIMVDGGVDSLMHGDEYGAGTLIEDSISLAAVSQLDVPVKILACLGFGTEVEEGVCHYQALENIAELMQKDAFLGGCTLTKQMRSFQLFEEACRYVWEHNHTKSHIATKIIPATHGKFGDYQMYENLQREDLVVGGKRTFINPLMSQYWFFDLNAVCKENLLVKTLKQSHTFVDARMLYRQFLSDCKLKPCENIPL